VVVLVYGKSQESFVVCHDAKTPALRESILARRCLTKRLRVYLPRNSRPVRGRTLRQAVDTYAIFGFRRRFSAQDTAFLGFFDRNEPAFAAAT